MTTVVQNPDNVSAPGAYLHAKIEFDRLQHLLYCKQAGLLPVDLICLALFQGIQCGMTPR